MKYSHNCDDSNLMSESISNSLDCLNSCIHNTECFNILSSKSICLSAGVSLRRKFESNFY